MAQPGRHAAAPVASWGELTPSTHLVRVLGVFVQQQAAWRVQGGRRGRLGDRGALPLPLLLLLLLLPLWCHRYHCCCFYCCCCCCCCCCYPACHAAIQCIRNHALHITAVQSEAEEAEEPRSAAATGGRRSGRAASAAPSAATTAGEGSEQEGHSDEEETEDELLGGSGGRGRGRRRHSSAGGASGPLDFPPYELPEGFRQAPHGQGHWALWLTGRALGAARRQHAACWASRDPPSQRSPLPPPLPCIPAAGARCPVWIFPTSQWPRKRWCCPPCAAS